MIVKCGSKVNVIRRSRRVEISNIKRINLKKSNFKRKPTNKFAEIIIDSKEIKEMLGRRISGKKILEKKMINYPKYFYGFINKANKQSGATHSRNVGKLHSLFKNRKFENLNEWKKWYLSKYPKAIQEATNTILFTLKEACVDTRKYKKYVKLFVENLIINQTYSGLKIQEIVLIKMASILKQDYRWSTDKEDSSGIDGFVGDIPVSVKPVTSQQKKKAGVKRANYTINKERNILSFTFSL